MNHVQTSSSSQVVTGTTAIVGVPGLPPIIIPAEVHTPSFALGCVVVYLWLRGKLKAA